MTPRQPRDLYPWEAHCGCPTCKAKPRARCTTLKSRYRARNGGGLPTHAHQARYLLWCHLWGWEPWPVDHPRHHTRARP